MQRGGGKIYPLPPRALPSSTLLNVLSFHNKRTPM
jgi:hypothetical protein